MGYYLTKHGKETYNKVIENLKELYNVNFPLSVKVLGLGDLEFNSRDELFGFIYGFKTILNVERRSKDGK